MRNNYQNKHYGLPKSELVKLDMVKVYPGPYSRQDMVQDEIAKQNKKAYESVRQVDKMMGMEGIK